MSVTRISGSIFGLLAIYVGIAPILLSAAPVGAPASGPLVVLGLAWYFAVWGALVAAMVFLIAWTGAAFTEMESTREVHRAETGPVGAEPSPRAGDKAQADPEPRRPARGRAAGPSGIDLLPPESSR
jgi:hypothetical protein